MKISLLLGVLFIMSNQPMLMIMIMMLMVLVFSVFIYFESNSFWFGYMLMLVLLSGVLVIFTYVVSLIPNESFEFLSLLFLVFFFLLMFVGENQYFMKMDESFICLMLWETLMLAYMMYLVMFLLMIMVMVIFVSYPQIGALRLYLCAW